MIIDMQPQGDMAVDEMGVPAPPPPTPAEILEGMSADQKREAANALRAKLAEKHKAQRTIFNDWAISHLESKRKQCDDLRERDPRGFKKRIDRNERRTRNEVDIVVDAATRKTIPWLRDGHAFLGVGSGLTAQCVRAAGAYLNGREFEVVDTFVKVSGVGRKKENRPVAKCLEYWLMDMFNRSGYEAVKRRCNEEVPKNGCSVLRMKPWCPSRMKRGKDGVYRLEQESLQFKFDRWPIQDVLFTNPEAPFAWLQEGVSFINRGCTLREIEANEVEWTIVPAEDGGGIDGTGIALRRVSGRFVDTAPLIELEEALGDSGASAVPASNYYTSDNSSSRRGEKSSSFPVFDVVEYEGAFPWYEAVMGGYYTIELADMDGIDVGFRPTAGDKVSMRKWASLLNQITHWEMSYTHSIGNSGSPTGNHLIELHPCSYETGKNSAYVIGYIRDEDKLMGKSISDLGHKIEDAHDHLYNARIWRGMYSANPTVGRDAMAVKGSKDDLVIKMGGVVDLQAGQSAQQALQVLSLPPEDLDTKIGIMRDDFYLVVGVSQITVNGKGKSGTLGGQQIEQSNSEKFLDNVFLTNNEEVVRLCKDMIEIAYEALGAEGFAQELMRVGGIDAARIMEFLPSKEKLWNEFVIDHPAKTTGDPVMLAASMLQQYTTFGGDATYITPEVARQASILAGTGSADHLLRDTDILSVEDELFQLAQGNTIEFSTMESPQEMVARLMQHKAMQAQIMQTGRAVIGKSMIELDPEAVELLRAGLEVHIPKLESMAMVAAQNLALGGGQAQTQNMAYAGQPVGGDQYDQSARASENEHRVSTVAGEQTV